MRRGSQSRSSRRRELAINIPGFGVMLANKLRKLERIKFHDFSCCMEGGRGEKRGFVGGICASLFQYTPLGTRGLFWNRRQNNENMCASVCGFECGVNKI